MDCSSFNTNFQNCTVPALENLFNFDPELRMFEKEIKKRFGMFEDIKRSIEQKEGMDRFTKSYERYGVVMMENGGVGCVEWAPNALALYLQGDFSNWEKVAYKSKDCGKWELLIPPNRDGSCPIQHLSELKLVIETKDHQTIEKISPWAKYVMHRSSGSVDTWKFWNPPQNRSWEQKQHFGLSKPDRLRIYQVNIANASKGSEISTYQSFTRDVLTRIRDLGYNCVLLTTIMDQSFHLGRGCQATNFFAASSRYGTPGDLKKLIKVAHEMGLCVLMDVTHNQASKNIQDGTNKFDGSEGCYLDHRSAGYNEGNDRNAFDYTKWEVLRFLMSNLRYFLEEFSFNGFRFNGVTSMMYRNHGFAGRSCTEYDRNCSEMQMDFESMVYLMLANYMIHRLYPNAITIAEDYSAMPTLCRPVHEGGIGFDYRATMNVPDIWLKLLTKRRDEDWDMELLSKILSSRKMGEKCIAYTENHEQITNGRMTLSRHLFGCEDMTDMKPLTPALDRGLSLYKMIRLMTHSLAGEGYLNIMGNEFGHPNLMGLSSLSNNNMERAREQFHLADDNGLRYKYLNRFDKAMNLAEKRFGWLRTASVPAFVSQNHNENKVFVYERAGLLFMFNFHPTRSFFDYKVGVEQSGRYKVILDTDDKQFGGKGRNQQCLIFVTEPCSYDNKSKSLRVNLPSRTALVLAQEDVNLDCSFEDNTIQLKGYDDSCEYSRSQMSLCGAVQSYPNKSCADGSYSDRGYAQRRRSSCSDVNRRSFLERASCGYQQSCYCNDRRCSNPTVDIECECQKADCRCQNGKNYIQQQTRRYW